MNYYETQRLSGFDWQGFLIHFGELLTRSLIYKRMTDSSKIRRH